MEQDDVNNKTGMLYESLTVLSVAVPCRTESRIRGDIPRCLGKFATCI